MSKHIYTVYTLCPPCYCYRFFYSVFITKKKPFWVTNVQSLKTFWWILFIIENVHSHIESSTFGVHSIFSLSYAFEYVRASLSARISKLFCLVLLRFGWWRCVTICLCVCKRFLQVLILQNVYMSALYVLRIASSATVFSLSTSPSIARKFYRLLFSGVDHPVL